MQHRDKIIIQKVISEIDVGVDMLGDASVEDFINLKKDLEKME